MDGWMVGRVGMGREWMGGEGVYVRVNGALTRQEFVAETIAHSWDGRIP